jgi:hypothetical protein
LPPTTNTTNTTKEQYVPEWRPAVEREACARLGAAEADAFAARLELLSADITEPLAHCTVRSPTRASSRPPWSGTRWAPRPPARSRCACWTGGARSTPAGSSGRE